MTVLTKDDILNGIKKRVKIKLAEYENKEIIIRPLSDGEFCSILARVDLSDLDDEKEIDENEIYNQEDTNTTSAGGNQEEYNNGSLSTNTGKFNDSSNSNLSRQKGKNTMNTTDKTLVKSKKAGTKNYFDDILKNRDFILMVTEVGIVEPKLSRSALESMYFGVPERIGSKILEISSFLSPDESKKKLKK